MASLQNPTILSFSWGASRRERAKAEGGRRRAEARRRMSNRQMPRMLQIRVDSDAASPLRMHPHVPSAFHLRPPPSTLRPSSVPRRELTLFDSTCIIVGIIIGAGIYRSSPDVARLAPSVTWLIGLWLLGGLLSLIGALCYAELATAYPQGGRRLRLSDPRLRPAVGFLFAWCQLWIVRPGSIGAMAYAFAEYANQIWPQAEGADGRLRAGGLCRRLDRRVDGGQHPRRAGRQMDAERADHRQGAGVGGDRGGRLSPIAAPDGSVAGRRADVVRLLAVRLRPGDDLRPVHLRRLERDGLRRARK